MNDLPREDMPDFAPENRDGFWYQDIKVLNKHGLHARPSAKFFESVLQPYGDSLDLAFKIHRESGDAEFMSIRSVFDLMSLGLEMGTLFTIRLKYTGSHDEFDGESGETFIARLIHSLFLDTFTEFDNHVQE